jgi:hypothetical protein
MGHHRQVLLFIGIAEAARVDDTPRFGNRQLPAGDAVFVQKRRHPAIVDGQFGDFVTAGGDLRIAGADGRAQSGERPGQGGLHELASSDGHGVSRGKSIRSGSPTFGP